jgi:DHA1 family multidrug resistance protein-like MFS transporter
MYVVQSRVPISPASTHLTSGIRLIAWSRAIRWIGWGFGEALLPILILQISHNITQAGFLRAVYGIALLVTLPLAGLLVDRLSAKKLMFLGFGVYPLVGISYFLAGQYNEGTLLIMASALSGLLHGIELLSVATYYRRMAIRTDIGSSFGYLDTISNLGWIAAALLGAVLTMFLPIHYLFLALIPTAMSSLALVAKAPKDAVRWSHTSPRSLFTELRRWDARLWLLSALALFSAVVASVMWFFIPIDTYQQGADLVHIVLLTVVATIPTLSGYWLGKLADRYSKCALVSICLVGIALLCVGLALFSQYAFRLFASFSLGVIIELISIIQASLLTTLGFAVTYGRRASLFSVITTLGVLGAPLLIASLLLIMNLTQLLLLVGGCALLLLVGYIVQRSLSSPKHLFLLQ